MNSSQMKMLLLVAIGCILWFIPTPEGLTDQAWQMMAIFVTTVLSLILAPLPLGAMALMGLTLATLLGVLPIKTALTGFAHPTIWMIAAAFFISRGFITTGFGRRVGYWFISKLGHNSLGLAYGLVLTDLLFAPATPSTTARCGGIISPLFRSVASAYDSDPEKGTENRIGAFLVQCIFQCNAITCAMFLTSMAGNPLAANFAKEQGVEITWAGWATAAIVPGLLCLFLIPLVMYMVFPPELKKTPEMREIARQKLAEMGKMTRDELMVCITFIGIGPNIRHSCNGYGFTRVSFLASHSHHHMGRRSWRKRSMAHHNLVRCIGNDGCATQQTRIHQLVQRVYGRVTVRLWLGDNHRRASFGLLLQPLFDG